MTNVQAEPGVTANTNSYRVEFEMGARVRIVRASGFTIDHGSLIFYNKWLGEIRAYAPGVWRAVGLVKENVDAQPSDSNE